ncbi:MAG: hypothetical protein D6805_08170 [Planctomycetota bacterium]|nr:MAG: hypothetical protein D6805_08170 [Planctomycetota bacterium]
MQLGNTISPVVEKLVAYSHPLGHQVDLGWRQSADVSFRILRRAWRWPSGKELPLFEVSKSYRQGSFSPSAFAFLDSFDVQSNLKKVVAYQFREAGIVPKGMLLVFEHSQESITLKTYKIEGSWGLMGLLESTDFGFVEIQAKSSPQKKDTEITEVFWENQPEQPLFRIHNSVDQETNRRLIQLELLTGEWLTYQTLQILELEKMEDYILGKFSDIGLQPEIDYHYSFEPLYPSSLPRSQAHARAFGSYGMHRKITQVLPSHYFTHDRGGFLTRFLECIGYMLNNIQGLAEELRDIQDVDRARLELLPYLAKWIGWDVARSNLNHLRDDLKEATWFYRKKGTKRALIQLIQKLAGKRCEKVVEYRHFMFFTNDPLHRTNTNSAKTCYYPPSCISLVFSPFEEWSEEKNANKLDKENLKETIERFLPAHVELVDIQYINPPLRERYSGVRERSRLVMEGDPEWVTPSTLREKVQTTLLYSRQNVKIFRTNTSEAKTNNPIYRTYHPILHKNIKKN